MEQPVKRMWPARSGLAEAEPTGAAGLAARVFGLAGQKKKKIWLSSKALQTERFLPFVCPNVEGDALSQRS